MAMNAYVSIGNSDDKLTQKEWMMFIRAVREQLRERWDFHGEWFSAPDSEWQNANWCVELNDVFPERVMRELLRNLASSFGQDSIALVVAEPELRSSSTDFLDE